MPRMKNKTCLITGAAQGLGEACARMLAKEGARVVLTDINETKVAEAARSIGASAISLAHDVTDEQQWQSVLATTVEHFGGLDVLVNNAGIFSGTDVESTSFDDWKQVHAVNLDSVFLGCKYAIDPMRKSGGGSIINMSSVSGIIAGHNTAAYNSSKAAVRHLSKSVALHCAKQQNGVRCNSIHPVFMATPILDDIIAAHGKERAYEKLGRQIPIGHIGEPDDVAYAVLYLASDESKMVTGTELVIDGGLSAM